MLVKPGHEMYLNIENPVGIMSTVWVKPGHEMYLNMFAGITAESFNGLNQDMRCI